MSNFIRFSEEFQTFQIVWNEVINIYHAVNLDSKSAGKYRATGDDGEGGGCIHSVIILDFISYHKVFRV